MCEQSLYLNKICLLSFPGCCWISSNRNFFANSINPFIGLFGLSGSCSFFFIGDIGGDIIPPLAEGSREAIPWRRWLPPLLGPPGENWSARSWLQTKQKHLNKGKKFKFNIKNINFLKEKKISGLYTYNSRPGKLESLEPVTQIWGFYCLWMVRRQTNITRVEVLTWYPILVKGCPGVGGTPP